MRSLILSILFFISAIRGVTAPLDFTKTFYYASPTNFYQAVGAVSINPEGFVILNPSLVRPLVNEKYLAIKMLEMILTAVKDDDVFHEIFCSEHISYDIIYRQIQIENAAFGFRHANFRQLLINFIFLQPHPDSGFRKFIINPKFKTLPLPRFGGQESCDCVS